MIKLETDVVNTLIIIFSPFLLLWGKKFFKPLLYIACGLFGAYVVQYFFAFLNSIGLNVPGGAILGTQIAVGLLFGFLVLKFIQLGVVILGGTAVMLAVNVVFNIIVQAASLESPHMAVIHGVILLVSFIIGGYIGTFIFEGIAVPAITSILGGFLFVSGVNYWLWKNGHMSYDTLALSAFFQADSASFICPEKGCYALLAVWLVLSLAGFGIQTKLIKYDHHHKKNGQPEEA